jgi:hypothetical protein
LSLAATELENFCNVFSGPPPGVNVMTIFLLCH